MAMDSTPGARPAHVIVVGNEKGGSGKSTVAMNIAIALLKAGGRVATVDLDARQRSLTNYIENRRAWARRVEFDLAIPDHTCFEAPADGAAAEALTVLIGRLADGYDHIVIDTPGHDTELLRQVHDMADTLVTPLNDSFVDFDVLGTVDPDSFGVIGIGHYGRMVEEARSRRQRPLDWIVMRNRLNSTRTRNKRMVGEGLAALARQLNFRCVEGLAERLIFREFYPRGLTAIDSLDEATLGTRPTMSHASARFEIESLLTAMGLGETAGEETAERNKTPPEADVSAAA